MKRIADYGVWMLSVATILVATMDAQSANWKEKLVGTWKQNIDKSQVFDMPLPIAAVLVISEASPSHFEWKVTSTFSQQGWTTRLHYAFDGAIDGKPYDYRGAPRGTKLSYIEDNGTLQSSAISPNGSTQHETITVSPDGNTLTAQGTYNSRTSKGSYTEVWERVAHNKQK